MKEVTTKYLKDNGAGKIKLGFHVPPMTSIPHLHMHSFKLPLHNTWRSSIDHGYFFREVDYQLALLGENSDRVP